MAKEKEPKRANTIALYGGAFDPVHNAHITVARSVLEQLNLDRICFIPAAQSPLKAGGPAASDVARLQMLRLATKDEPRFSVDPCELERGGMSYTLETVRHFSERRPDAKLYWIIGADQLELLDRWRRIEALAAMVVFLVVARPGYKLSAPMVPGLNWEQIDAPLMEESSSKVREALATGRSLRGVVPEAVEAFIQSEGLYTL
ncbi:MAG: nicotinate (nicotinamide) nucleotide adenylyltransferase [Verrucomicrobiota bacterium]